MFSSSGHKTCQILFSSIDEGVCELHGDARGRGAGLEALSGATAGGAWCGRCAAGTPTPRSHSETRNTGRAGREAEGNVHLTKFASQSQSQGLHGHSRPEEQKPKYKRKWKKKIQEQPTHNTRNLLPPPVSQIASFLKKYTVRVMSVQ